MLHSCPSTNAIGDAHGILAHKVGVLADLDRKRCVRRGLVAGMQTPHPVSALRNTIRPDIKCIPWAAAPMCAHTACRRRRGGFRCGARGVRKQERELGRVGVLVCGRVGCGERKRSMGVPGVCVIWPFDLTPGLDGQTVSCETGVWRWRRRRSIKERAKR